MFDCKTKEDALEALASFAAPLVRWNGWGIKWTGWKARSLNDVQWGWAKDFSAAFEGLGQNPQPDWFEWREGVLAGQFVARSAEWYSGVSKDGGGFYVQVAYDAQPQVLRDGYRTVFPLADYEQPEMFVTTVEAMKQWQKAAAERLLNVLEAPPD